MNTWVRDIIDMAGGAYRQLINEFLQGESLEGRHARAARRARRFEKLKANVLNVIAEADHITPPCQSEGVMDLLGSATKKSSASAAATSASWPAAARKRPPGRISTSGSPIMVAKRMPDWFAVSSENGT